MKKILFVMLLCLVAITGCGKKETRVELNSTNFEEYFSITPQITNVRVDNVKTIIGNEQYGYLTLKLSITPKKEFKTENVTFNVSTKFMGYGWVDAYSILDVNVDVNGRANVEQDVKSSSSLIRPDSPTITGFYEPSVVSGVEASDKLFFIGNKKHIIGDLKGSIIIEE